MNKRQGMDLLEGVSRFPYYWVQQPSYQGQIIYHNDWYLLFHRKIYQGSPTKLGYLLVAQENQWKT